MVKIIFPHENPRKQLSDFEFLSNPKNKDSKVGVGSFASVKLAREKRTGRKYAIKIIPMDEAKLTESDLHNIRTEIGVHRRLDHSNIVKFHDYMQDSSNVYLILDYAENGNLYSYIHKRKTLAPEEIFRFFYQACLAIQYVHLNDVLHRDIKPENLLLDENWDIKLCDFGWAAQRIKEKRLTFCGTYEYMAPEIVFKKHYDYRVDIWSLGVLLYELTHREAPYKGRSLSEITKSLSKTQMTFSPKVEPEVKDLIQKILKMNPNDRLSIAQILSHPWVQSHLSPNEDDFLHTEEIRVCPRGIIPTPSQKRYDTEINVQFNRKANPHFKSEILTTTGSETIIEGLESGLTKISNINTCGSTRDFSTSLVKKSKMSSKENQHFKHGQLINTEISTPTYSELRDSPTITDQFAHIKRSAKEVQTLDNKNRRESGHKNKRIFENSILSPNFKSKVDNIIHQLCSQTSTHRTARDVYTDLNVRSPLPSHKLGKNIFSEVTLNTMRKETNQYDFHRDVINRSGRNNENRAEPIASPIASLPKKTFEGFNPSNIISEVKEIFSKNIGSAFNEGNSVSQRGLAKSSLTNRYKGDAHTYDKGVRNGIDGMISPINNRNVNGVLSVHDQNSPKHVLSYNKVYKGLDMKRKQSFKPEGDLSPAKLHISSISEKRYANKEN